MSILIAKTVELHIIMVCICIYWGIFPGPSVAGGGAPIFIRRPRTGSGRWSWYGLVSLSLMIRGVLPPGIQDAR